MDMELVFVFTRGFERYFCLIFVMGDVVNLDSNQYIIFHDGTCRKIECKLGIIYIIFCNGTRG